MGRERPINQAQAARLYHSGLSLPQVAAKLHASVERVRAYLCDAGVAIRNRGRPRHLVSERAVRLYQTPMTLQQVADQLGWSKTTVWNHLHRAGVLRSSSAGWAVVREPIRQKVLEAWQHGYNVTESARRAGCAASTASQYIRAAGYRSHRKGRAGCGPLVRAARVAAGLTQTEVARRAGMKQSSLSDLERGRWNPTRPLLVRIAAALGCPVQRLLPPLAKPDSTPGP
jgi:DNA-binding XRE family transcriptional regulator